MDLEALLLAAIVGIAAAPLLTRVRGPARRASALAVILGVSLAGGWAAVRARVLPVPERDVEIRPIAVEDEGYTSSDSCQSCHPSQHASWYATYHRTMTRVATPETVAADFGPPREPGGTGEFGIKLTAYGKTERMWREGDTYWIERDNPLWSPTSIEERKIVHPIVLTTGSHNMQFYWYSTGHSREVGLAGFIYLIEQQRFIPYAAEGMMPPPEMGGEIAPPTGSWNRGCIHCHTTRAKMRILPNPVRPANPLEPHKNVLDTQVTEFGISCEACHGPGEEHAKRNRDPQRRYAAHLRGGGNASGDRAAERSDIVNPRDLSPRRSAQVCGQCHGVVLAFRPTERGRAQRDLSIRGFAYRPGDDLGETRKVIRPRDERDRDMELLLGSQPHFVEERFWSDGVVRVTGREYNALLDSPCFRDGHDDGDLTCLSCHDLHRRDDDPRALEEWADDLLRPGMDGDEACLQCHESFRRDLTAHTRHAPESSGSRCYNCHMPYTSYGLLKAIRSHTIESPDVAASVETGRPNACSQCHLDRTLAWASEELFERYGTPRPDLGLYERSVAAGVDWMLRGDAGQRGLIAWTMGWGPAQEASGTSWMGEFLPVLLEDPYANVRFIAHRSMRRLPEFRDFEFDFLAEPLARRAARDAALSLWRAGRIEAGEPTTGLHLLDDPRGELPPDVFATLLRERDDRRVVLKE